MKKPKKPKFPKPIPKPFRRDKTPEEKVSDALSNVPRITNDTVTEHREEVLSSARKYIYPLQHSKHHVVRISVSILIAVLIVFFAFCTLDLYKFQGTSGFIYDITRIVPFPVGKVGNQWISYESYLFELRRNMHYYQAQQQATFDSKDGKNQLKRLKQQALAQVTQDAYVKQLAKERQVSVSDQAVTNQLNLVKSENRLGSNNRVFREVLSEYWGWNETDFRRELKQQLLTHAVVAKLDSSTNHRAQAALQQLKGGADFGTLATQVSDDQVTKGAGGQYPNVITINDRDIPPAVTATIFKLKPGQISGIVNTGFTLDVVKLIDLNSGSAHAAHIQFNLKPITTYTAPLQSKQPVHYYIHI